MSNAISRDLPASIREFARVAIPDSLPVEIARYNLTQCVYLSLICSSCGWLRAAIPQIPDGPFVACPSCNRKSENFRVLGEGGTVRALPFWEKARQVEEPDPINQFWRTRAVYAQLKAEHLTFAPTAVLL